MSLRRDLRHARRALRAARVDLEEPEVIGEIEDTCDDLEKRIEYRRGERKERRRQFWSEDFPAWIREFGPAILDVVVSVAQVAAADRADRVGVAIEAIVDHAGIPLDDAESADVAKVANRIVDALELDDDD